jgi:hypothetical protein
MVSGVINEKMGMMLTYCEKRKLIKESRFGKCRVRVEGKGGVEDSK